MEMAEAANILRRSTQRSLLLIDEVGRGTGTLDGLAIAQAICEFLLCARGAGSARALCDALSRAVRAERALELGCELSHHGGREHRAPAARRSFRIAFSPEARRARSESRSRAWPGLPEAVIERAQEIADALSGDADIEARVPLRKKMPKRAPPSANSSLCPEIA